MIDKSTKSFLLAGLVIIAFGLIGVTTLSEDAEETDAASFTMTLSVSETYTGCSMTVSAPGYSTVTVSAGETKTMQVDNGVNVTFTANLSNEWELLGFRSLQGYIGSSNPTTYETWSDYPPVVYLELNKKPTYTVTINAGTGGTVSRSTVTDVPSGSYVNVYGDEITINGTLVTARPSSGYMFDEWSIPSYTVTSNMTIYAYFKQGITISLLATGYSGCTASISASGYTTQTATQNSGASLTVSSGTRVSVAATSGTGYAFVSWTKIGTTQVYTTNPYQFSATSNTTFSPNFTESIDIAITVGTGGSTVTLSSNTSATWSITSYATKATLSTTSGTSTLVTPSNYGYVKVRATNNSDSTDYDEVTLDICRVVYNANGGSGAPATQYYIQNDAGHQSTHYFTLDTSTTPTYSGHKFLGWNQTSSGSGTISAVTVSYRSSTTVYAVWSEYLKVTVGTAGPTLTLTSNVSATWTITTNSSKASLSSLSGKSTVITPSDYGYIVVRATNNADSSDYVDTTLNISRVAYNANGGSNPPSATYYIQTGTSSHTFTLNTSDPPTYSGHTFKGWGTTSSATTTVSSVSVAYRSSSTVYAVWEGTYTVTIQSNNQNYGTVSTTTISDIPSGSTIIVSRNTLTLNGTIVTATPSSGYAFGSWSNATEPITSNRTITANFVQGYTITTWIASEVDIPGCSITISAPGYDSQIVSDVTESASLTVPSGTAVTLSAAYSGDYAFAKWVEATTVHSYSDNPYTFTVSSNRIITAVFEDITYHFLRIWAYDYADDCAVQVHINGTYDGVTDQNGAYEGYVKQNSTVKLIPVPGIGAYFSYWSHDDSTVSPLEFTMPSSDFRTTAHFEYYNYTVTFDAMTNGGTLVGDQTKTVQYIHPYGELPTATKPYSNFTGWFTESTGGTQITSTSIVMTASDHTLYAQFATDVYNVTITAGTGGTVNPTTVPNVPAGSVITPSENTLVINGTTVTATSSTGYLFSSWDNIDDPVTSDTEITANFVRAYTITTWIASEENLPGCSITISATGYDPQTVSDVTESISLTVPEGTIVMLTAEYDGDYEFSQWAELPTSHVYTQNPYSFTASSDRLIMGLFRNITYNTLYVWTYDDHSGCAVNVYVNDTYVGATDENGAYSGLVQEGSEVKLVAIPSATAYFSYWSHDDSTANPCIFAMPGNNFRTTAHFEVPEAYSVWWDNEYVNGRVDVLFKFDNTANNYVHRMVIPLWRFNADDVAQDTNDEPSDGQWNFDQTSYMLRIDVDYTNQKTTVTTTVLNGSTPLDSQSLNIGNWPQFILRIDAQESAISFMGISKWVNNDFTFVNYDVIFTKQIYTYTSIAEELAIKKIYHEDMNNASERSSNHVRFQVVGTTTWLDTYGFVMVDPSLNIYSQFPDYENIRLNLYSFAMFGETMTLNGWKFTLDGSVITDLYYIEVTEPVLDEDGNLTGQKIKYNMICNPTTEGAIHITPTLQNIYITWENLTSDNDGDRICYLTFVDESFSVRLGTFEKGNLTISFTGVWYFTTAVYEPYMDTLKTYSMDWGNWFNISADAFMLIFIGAVIGITALITSISGWRLELYDWAVVIGAAVVIYVLLGAF